MTVNKTHSSRLLFYHECREYAMLYLHIFLMISSLLQPKYLFVLVLASYLAFGLHHLSEFVTADEHYWVSERIPQYWDAVSQGKWRKTFINDKPGVSLALVSGVATWLSPQSEEHCVDQKDKTILCQTNETAVLYHSFRLPILLLNGCLLILLFYLISKLTTPYTALLATTLTALSPILLGISQILNPDSLLWSFGTIGLFSFLVFLKENQWRFLILTTLCTGFALLSKYAALVLVPFYFFLILASFLFREDSLSSEKKFPLGRPLAALALVTGGAITLLCLFLPALLLNEKYSEQFLATIPHKGILFGTGGFFFGLLLIDVFFFRSTFLIKIRHLIERHFRFFRIIPLLFFVFLSAVIILRVSVPNWDIFASLPFDIKNFENARYYGVTVNFFEAFLLEWNPLVFTLTPITLFGLGFFLIRSFQKQNPQLLFFAVIFPVLSFAYLVLFLISDVLVTPRYSILLFSFMAFLAALGLSSLTDLFTKKYAFAPLALFFLVFGASLISLLRIEPFYFNYSNFLLPKHALVSDSWGYGGYEAAQFLNSLPEAEQLTVWSDYYGVCEFFHGRCLTAYTFDKETIQPDYYVLTRRGGIRYRSRYDRWEEKSGLVAYKYYTSPNPAWELLIGDRPGNFVRVVKVEKETP